jgi:2-keto-4-pentenoate hydratase
MGLGQTDIDAMAQELWDANRTGKPIAPLSERVPAPDEVDAYAIQSVNTERRVASGATIAGRKIGLTSLAVQKQLGVDQPDFGSIYSDLVFGDGEEIDPGVFIAPKVEAEIAFVLGRDVDREMPTAPDILRAIEYVLPSIEIVDCRIADWKIRFVDTVADNASFGAAVFGGPARKIDDLDLRLCGMTMDLNGAQASTGIGAACLGHPLNAAVWLARKLAFFGTPLREGDIIMTGALGPMVPVKPGDAAEAQIDGLGSVRVRIGEN